MRRLKARVFRNIGPESEWLANNPVLMDGEVAYVRFGSRIRTKVGNGVLSFSALGYQDSELKISGVDPSFPFVSGEGPAPEGIYLAKTSGIYNGDVEVDTEGKIVFLLWDGVSELEVSETELPPAENKIKDYVPGETYFGGANPDQKMWKGQIWTVRENITETTQEPGTGSDWKAEITNVPADGEIIEGDSRPVSGETVDSKFRYGELFSRMELPQPFAEIELINVLQNNNFNSIWGGTNYVSQGVSSNVYTWISTAEKGRVIGSTDLGDGDKVFFKIDVKATSDQVRAWIIGAVPAVGSYHSGSGNFERLSAIVTPSTASGYLGVSDERTAGWDSIQIKKGVVINLTNVFGEGNEPSLSEMNGILDTIPESWFPDSFTLLDKTITEGMTFVNRNGIMKMEPMPLKGFEGKTIVCFGDSVTEFGDYPEQLARSTGATVIDAGIGGTRLTYYGNIPNYDDLCFVRLVEAIISNDWTQQDIAIANLIELGDDNSENYNALKAIEWDSVDAVVFMYGTNDYVSFGVSIGNPDDTDVYRNINGALNYVFTEFSSHLPDILLFPITPIFRYRDGTNNSDVEPGREDGIYLYDLAQTIVDRAKQYHVPVLDLYNSSGINRYNALTYIADGTHPTQKGYNIIADKISKHVLTK